ncbi:hypothetical protein GQ54DRAFT_294956 [Martensiomyces pterosporus]|nr:hypothetical protein GQ54DRAFT_294956 [Martensiomyces pterosporus]
MSAEESARKRRRGWDQGGEKPEDAPPLKQSATASEESKEAVLAAVQVATERAALAAAAAKGEAESSDSQLGGNAAHTTNTSAESPAQKGGSSGEDAYVPPPIDSPTKKNAESAGTFAQDVDINLSANRQSLAKGATQKIIMEQTGAELSTKGRYYANPADATPDDPALHLHVEAATQEILDRAVAMIERMKDEAPPPPVQAENRGPTPETVPSSDGGYYSRSNQRYGSGGHAQLQDKVYVDIDSERGFNVRAKLIGTGGENMKYIQNTTGTRVQVRGRGSGFIEGSSGSEAFEPMHLHISAHSEDSLKQAKDLCQSLVDTIRSQYQEFKEGGRSNRRHDHYGYRDTRDYYDHHSSRYSYQQQPPPAQQYQQYQQQPQYPGTNDESDQQASKDAASYDEYANYYAQYYQYYGTYPDYASYYGQTDPSAPTAAEYQQQAQDQQQPADASKTHEHPPDSNRDPLAPPDAAAQPPAGDGYHNVPPPTNYSNGSKRKRS